MKILVSDDHPLVREGLRQVVNQLAAEVEMLEANDWPSALAQVALHPDIALALVDLHMPGMEGFAGLGKLLEQSEAIAVVVVSASESVLDMKRALDAGAMGYLAKRETVPVVLSALRLVLSGGMYVPPQLIQLPQPRSGNRAGAHPLGLTARQFEVLTKMVQGTSNKEIARGFNLSGATIKAHIGAIFKTLKVSSRIEAIRITQGLQA